MWCKSPAVDEIQPGNTVSIRDRKARLRGRARLIERRPTSWGQDNLTYILHERDTTYARCLIWSQQRWLVEWEEHPRLRPGTQGVVYVYFFVRQASRANIWNSLADDVEVPPGLTSEKAVVNAYLFIAPEIEVDDNSLKALKNVVDVVVVGDGDWADDALPEIEGAGFADNVQVYIDMNEVEKFTILAGRNKKMSTHKRNTIKCQMLSPPVIDKLLSRFLPR